MRKRMTFQLVLSEADGALTGRLFRPKFLESGVRIPRIYGYDLSFGIPTVQFNTADDPRDQATVHLGTKVQAFDSNAEPNVGLYRFSDVQIIATSGVMPKREQRVPWVSCDLTVPWLFVGMIIDSTTTTQDYILTGNIEYEWVEISDDQLVELMLFWELKPDDWDAFTPGLTQATIRSGSANAPPYFLVRSTEEL